MSFEAKYAFTCGTCDERHPVGTTAQYDADHTTVSAVHCAEQPPESNGAGFDSFTRGRAPIAVLPRGKTGKDRCDKCFIVHASGQVECEW
jgi:hypothetical protein